MTGRALQLSALLAIVVLSAAAGAAAGAGAGAGSHLHKAVKSDGAAATPEEFDWLAPCANASLAEFPWCDTQATPKARAASLVRAMNLTEKARTMIPMMPPNYRLRLPPIYTTDALHGAYSSSAFPNCTVFPQAVANAASFDREYLKKMARVAADETRAKTNGDYRNGGPHVQSWEFSNIVWTPVVNICRDPRWGRCQETLGEDPFLTSELARVIVPSLQNGGLDNDKYLQVITTCKHFDVHGGPESASLALNGTLLPTNRMKFNTVISKREWTSEHQPAFEACVEAGVTSVMCSYNSINGVPSCANKELLTDLLVNTWNFTKDENFVVGDCGAVMQVHKGHHYAANLSQADNMALDAGVHWDCGGDEGSYVRAVNGTNCPGPSCKPGHLPEAQLDAALTKVLTAHVRLGFFDDPSEVAYKRLQPAEVIDTPPHRALAKWAASRVVVLLRNRKNSATGAPVLPLRFSKDQKIAVVGPNADNMYALWGDYASHDGWGANTTALKAAEAEVGATSVAFAPGCADTFCWIYMPAIDRSLRHVLCERQWLRPCAGGCCVKQANDNCSHGHAGLGTGWRAAERVRRDGPPDHLAAWYAAGAAAAVKSRQSEHAARCGAHERRRAGLSVVRRARRRGALDWLQRAVCGLRAL